MTYTGWQGLRLAGGSLGSESSTGTAQVAIATVAPAGAALNCLTL
jgi:hypothetical protein